MIDQNIAILNSKTTNINTSASNWLAYNNQICKDSHQAHFIEEDGVRFSNHHLIVDFRGTSKLDCLKTIANRFAQSRIKTKYYNPKIHLGSFALPQYVIDALD